MTGFNLMILPLDSRKPYPFLKTGTNEAAGQFSPDGRWLAYESRETGRYEAYVASFPGPGGQRQLSMEGGAQPRWRGDGKELFYIRADNQLMALDVSIKGNDIQFGAAHQLFGPLPNLNGYPYDVSTDGQRFLIAQPNAQAAPEPLTLMQNWTASLRK